jgi:hypothetical protein
MDEREGTQIKKLNKLPGSTRICSRIVPTSSQEPCENAQEYGSAKNVFASQAIENDINELDWGHGKLEMLTRYDVYMLGEEEMGYHTEEQLCKITEAWIEALVER